MRARVQRALLLAAVILTAATSAHNQQNYDVSGDDTYRIGTALPATTIVYAGSQRLTIDNDGPQVRRYTAEANYTRSGDGNKATVHARFVQDMDASGSFSDRTDEDPDFLTILNQPFAVQLDTTTLHDLRSMHGSIPFQAQSPLGGSRLHGFLRPQAAGSINGEHAVGVRFEAQGPITGALPQHPHAKISGTIRMDGTAYYADRSALLLALNATLTISGKLSSQSESLPVRIVYKRVIRADNAAPGWREAQSP